MNNRWSKEDEVVRGWTEYAALQTRLKNYIEDLAARPTRQELYNDSSTIVPEFKVRSEEYDTTIYELREILEEMANLEDKD